MRIKLFLFGIGLFILTDVRAQSAEHSGQNTAKSGITTLRQANPDYQADKHAGGTVTIEKSQNPLQKDSIQIQSLPPVITSERTKNPKK